MPAGDPGGNMQGGLGGNFGGFGGSSMNSQPGGPAHGSLGFGGMSPGGYNSSTYGANAGGLGGVPGFGKRVLDAQKARQLAQQRQFPGFTGNSLNPQPKPKPGVTGTGVVRPAVTTPPTEVVPGQPPYLSDMPGWGYPNHWNNANTPLPGEDNTQLPGPFSGWGSQHSIGNIGAGEYNSGGTGSGRVDETVGVGRQFGGPVEPGQQYTVGENGPETLQMGANGGGQVTPINPADRLGGMNPQMLQTMFQLQMGQRGKPTGQAPVGMPAPAGPAPLMRPPNTVPRVAPVRPQAPSMGFGGSGLGQQGVMGRLRSQLG